MELNKKIYENKSDFINDYEMKLFTLARVNDEIHEFFMDKAKKLVDTKGDDVLNSPAEYWVEKDLKEFIDRQFELNQELKLITSQWLNQ